MADGSKVTNDRHLSCSNRELEQSLLVQRGGGGRRWQPMTIRTGAVGIQTFLPLFEVALSLRGESRQPRRLCLGVRYL